MSGVNLPIKLWPIVAVLYLNCTEQGFAAIVTAPKIYLVDRSSRSHILRIV